VQPRGAAYSAGIMVGDRIVAVGGVPFDHVTHDEVVNAIKAAIPDRVRNVIPYTVHWGTSKHKIADGTDSSWASVVLFALILTPLVCPFFVSSRWSASSSSARRSPKKPQTVATLWKLLSVR
jgi:hypothetical protein